jgi:hypothetical protein
LDAFVLARLERAGLQPNPAADRLTLLRRVTYDLTGLAPTPAEAEAFLSDRSPDAWEKVVDRLLDSPRFGERWAQHWLDVVRYAETEGFKLDRLRPDAFRYRDYVIRAFNADLPYDRFVRQQLAGDELEPDNLDALIGSGFCRLHPEESNGANYRQLRQDFLDDVTDVFGSAFLGLTLGCARCHDHKFDPISQKEYFQLQSFFTPLLMLDEQVLASPRERVAYQRQLEIWQAATREVRADLDALTTPLCKKLAEEYVVTFDSETQEAVRLPPERRTPLQRQLAVLATKQIDRRVPRMAVRRLKPEQKTQYEALQKKLAEFDALKPGTLPTVLAATDAGPVAPATRRLAGGNYLRPKEEVRPAFPEVLDPAPPVIRPLPAHPASTGRRAALANWLCRPDHPLTARVIVNRMWQQYFGRGIVATPNDFGAMGGAPTHPELLDHLASELVANGWRLKALHRKIVTSATYRQDSRTEVNPTSARAGATDSDNTLLWHARARRRDAESIRDVLLQASGQLNHQMYGPSARPRLPSPVSDSRYAWYADEKAEDRNRRSVYVYATRILPLPLFQAFDQPDRNSSCPTRAVTTTPLQALALLNSEVANEQAQHLARRLLTAHGDDPHGLIRAAWHEVYTREPEPDEVAAAGRFLNGSLSSREKQRREQAVVDLCHALLNSAEFLYVE